MTQHKIMSHDGAWCWFQDPRAVFIQGRHSRTYAQWMTRDGKIQLGAYDHNTGNIEITTFKEAWGNDDHNVGSFLVLKDKRIMVFYAQHNGHGLFCRTSLYPEDIKHWEDEVTISDTERVTYSHPVYLAEENKYYVFWRGPSWKPTFASSCDGKIWSNSNILLQDSGRVSDTIRPYIKVASDGRSTIHFTFTDGHPQNEPNNSVYYLRYEKGRFYKADGHPIGDFQTLPIAHRHCDKIYDGSSEGRAWVWDIALDAKGRPVIASTRHPVEHDHQYWYTRWSGKHWHNLKIVDGGSWFPQTPAGTREPEPYYSGGIALNPSDPSTLYLSRGSQDGFVIEKWSTLDLGSTWASERIPQASDGLNVRPLVPRGEAGGASTVLWMHGDYVHYTDYKTGIHIRTL